MAVIAQFGGILLFWAVYAIAGLKPAIAATLALLVLELTRRAWRRERPPALFVALSALSITLGTVDLMLVSPLAIRFEGVVTNLVIAAMFAAGSRRAKPLMQHFAEAARGAFANDDPERTRFFRLLGLLWAGYFASRALVCLLTALWTTLPEALAIRSGYGIIAALPLVAMSFRARSVFVALQRRGWLAQRVGTGSAPE